MLQLMNKIADGKGTKADVAKIKEIGNAMKKASLCGLGQTAPNPVLSTMKFFKGEYDALLIDGNEPDEVKEDRPVTGCTINTKNN